MSRRDMVRLADQLIPFFKRAARSRTIDRYGKPTQVAELVLGNLRECQPFVDTLLPEADRDAIERAYRQYLALHGPLLAPRVRERRVIDGHGDLRCENICMTTPVNVFDCVEFQPAFRCGDLANDFSFLIMDLEFRGRQNLADTPVAEYRRRMHDPTFDAVLPFYQCHRSLVRGKVRGLAWLQHPHTPEGRRVHQRVAAGTDLSEAKPEHYDRLKAGYEPVRDWPSSAWTQLTRLYGFPLARLWISVALRARV